MRGTATPQAARHLDVWAALLEYRYTFWSVTAFSAVVNVLMLAGSIYMLQVYDRVLTSRSVPTLVALTLLLVVAHGFQGFFDIIRSRLVVRVCRSFDRYLADRVHEAALELAVKHPDPAATQMPFRDLDQIRAFFTSAGPIAIVDMPWLPLFLILCGLIHPWLGGLATAGAVVLVALTVLAERASRIHARALASTGAVRSAVTEAVRRNGEATLAMGMRTNVGQRWMEANERFVAAVHSSTDTLGAYGSASKIVRLTLQSAMLGLGAYLVIRQELTSGAMIAASIMMGRALAPVELAIANWRGFVAARESIRRLSSVFSAFHAHPASTALPAPSKSLEVAMAVAAPGSGTLILPNVQFRLGAGEVLGVIGPSGSGKSSLARAVVGNWSPTKGSVRLDGASLDQWAPEARGRYIGYVSQDVELFDGTIAENIARMHRYPDAEAVVAAARLAGAHDLIVRLPGGYDARTGEGGAILSAGQRQRIALARALFGDPFLLVLDEPNSNLDAAGEAALQRAINASKRRGAIVILIVHHQSSLVQCDKVLILMNGIQKAFGSRDSVLSETNRKFAPAAHGNLRVVADSKVHAE